MKEEARALGRNKYLAACIVGAAIATAVSCSNGTPAYAENYGRFVAGGVIYENGMDQAIDIAEAPIESTKEDYAYAMSEFNADFIDIPPAPQPAKAEPEPVIVETLNPYQELAARTTDEEWRLLEQILALEGNTEKQIGKRAIVEVIFNRALSSKWSAPWGGDTIKDVIYAKGQFSTVKYLSHPYATPGQAESDAIAETIAAGPSILPSTDYTYFSRGKSNGSGFVKVYEGSRHWFSHH